MKDTKMVMDNKGFVVQAPIGKMFHDGEPVIVFRAQDALLGSVLRHYITESLDRGVEPSQIHLAERTLKDVSEWQAAHKGDVKLPDYEKEGR